MNSVGDAAQKKVEGMVKDAKDEAVDAATDEAHKTMNKAADEVKKQGASS